MEQIRPLTSLSHDELIARIEQYVVVVELRDAEIRELHAANSALLAERDALAHDNAEYVGAASALATENQRLREALETMVKVGEMNGVGRAYAMKVARAALAQGQGD